MMEAVLLRCALWHKQRINCCRLLRSLTVYSPAFDSKPQRQLHSSLGTKAGVEQLCLRTCNHCDLTPSRHKPYVGQFRQVSYGHANPESVEIPVCAEFKPSEPDFDWNYLCDPANTAEIKQNIINRKGIGNIDKVRDLWDQLNDPDKMDVESFFQEREKDVAKLKELLTKETWKIPNRTHPDVPIGDESSSRLVETVGTKKEFDFEPKTVVQLGEDLGMLRTGDVGQTTGHRTYYFIGDLARLEHALIRFAVDKLLEKHFRFYTVPDMVHSSVIEGCGFNTEGNRTQVYKLDLRKHGNVCMIGTAEISLAALYMNKLLEMDLLPRKVATLSRCYRAETSSLEEEGGIYRVHQFMKVEMFGLTASDTLEDSAKLLQEIIHIQKEILTELGLHYRVLDMASQELGSPAYRKFDIEAWMPAKQFWGELTSASDCLDFQSRRLNMKYWTADGKLRHMHTVNGTACAIPRAMMAILENYQNKDGSVVVPKALQPYMNHQKLITKPAKPINMKWIQLTRMYKKQTKVA